MSISDDSKLGPLFTRPLEPAAGLTISDLNRYLSAIRSLEDVDMDEEILEGLFHGDGLTGLKKIPDAAVDLILADPPSSPLDGPDQHGRQWTLSQYYQWNQAWLAECRRVLKPTGSIYLFTHWRNSGMYQALLGEVFTIQTRITWRYLNGNRELSARAWDNCLGDIWFATRSGDFYFRDRSLKEEDFREHLPSANLWADIAENRVDQNELLKNTKPAAVLERIIRASSTKLNWIVDPFMRGGESGIAAKKLGRRFIGFEENRDNLLLAMKRIDQS